MLNRELNYEKYGMTAEMIIEWENMKDPATFANFKKPSNKKIKSYFATGLFKEIVADYLAKVEVKSESDANAYFHLLTNCFGAIEVNTPSPRLF